MHGARYSLYKCYITVDEGMLNASTISEVKCSIHLVFAITTHSNSDNSNPLALSSLAGVPTDSSDVRAQVIQASTFDDMTMTMTSRYGDAIYYYLYIILNHELVHKCTEKSNKYFFLF